VAHARRTASGSSTTWCRRSGTKALEQVRRFHRAQPSERGCRSRRFATHSERRNRSWRPRSEISPAPARSDSATGSRPGRLRTQGRGRRCGGGPHRRHSGRGRSQPAQPGRARGRDGAPRPGLAPSPGRRERPGGSSRAGSLLPRSALDRFAQTLAELGRDADIVPSAVRERLGISRKYLIPLLEWADGKGLTVRVGDVRRLRVTRKSP
jgi:hypothetical protein